jgi:surface polysaccharide O-acyltransferase-like enzyme
MISGAALLAHSPHHAPTTFYRRRLMRLLPPTLFWTLVYWGYTTHLRFDPGPLLGMVFDGRTHLWYLYMTLGLYAAAPFLSQFVASSSQRASLAAIILLFCTAAGYSIVKACLVDPRVGMSLFEWPLYCGYFLMGHYLTRGQQPTAQGAWRLHLLGLAVFCGTAVAVLTGLLRPYAGERASEVTYLYLNPLVIAMSISFFAAVYRSGTTQQAGGNAVVKTLVRIAPYSLGIYVIHPLSLRVVSRCGVEAWTFNPILGIPQVSVAAFIVSLVIVYAVSLVPVVRRVVV